MEKSARPEIGHDLELCLDFAGTMDWRTSTHATETLNGYSDLVSWGERKGLLVAGQARRLEDLGKGERGEEALRDARDLRSAIIRMFAGKAHGKEIDPEDVKILNGHLSRALAKIEVGATPSGYRWAWRAEESPDMMLFPVARSAADLLTSEILGRVKECANQEEGCGSLFLDLSKSQSRKWCSMQSCGNRAKFRTYYDRHVRAKA